MYLVIRASMVFGIFSNKRYMRDAIESYIKDDYETKGSYGWYHFKYIKFNPNEPWFSRDGEYNKEVGRALFSLSTLHSEYFKSIENDPHTGKLLKF